MQEAGTDLTERDMSDLLRSVLQISGICYRLCANFLISASFSSDLHSSPARAHTPMSFRPM